MRTIKALACAAALAAGLATAVAQNVYSLNVVGYYNVPVAANTYYAIANQLNTTNNTIGSLFPAPPVNANLLKWNPGAFRWDTYTFDEFDTVWLPDANATLNPGEAALFKSPTATTLTFVGEVLQGNPIAGAPALPAGSYAARASQVPQQGLLATDLKFPSEINDNVLKWNGAALRWDTFAFDEFDTVWLPNEPTFGVGEGMLVHKASSSTITTWTRNFTVQ